MAECCNVGALASLSIGGTRMDFIDFQHVRTIKMISDGSRRSIRGRLARNSNMVGEGMLFVEYRIGMYATADKLDILLPIMGLTESPTDTFTLGDVLPDTTVILGPKASPEEVYANSVCGRWSVSGQKGNEPVRIDLWFTGKTNTENTVNTTFISSTDPPVVEGYPYSFVNGSINAYGASRNFNQFRLSMDYGLIVEWLQSVSAVSICPSDHNLTLSTGVLYSTCDSNTDLWTLPLSGSIVGSSGTLNLDRSDVSKSTHFSLGNIKAIARPANVIKNDFLRLSSHFQVFAVGTASDLTCTNVA